MKNRPPAYQGHVIIVVSFIILMIVFALPSAFGVFFKPMSEELGWTRTATSGAFSLFSIVGGVIGILLGKFNDRLGPRIVVTLCGLLCGIGYFLMYFLHSLWQLYLLFGFLVGAGSVVNVPLISTVARWFTTRRSMMTGIVLTGSGLGTMIGPLIISRLIEYYGWRVSFLIPGLFLMVIVVLGAQFLRRDPAQPAEVQLGEKPDVEAISPSSGKPLSFKDAMTKGQFWLYFIIFFVSGFYVMAIQVHVVPYATDVGLSVIGAAAILTVSGATTMVSQIGMGHLGDKIGYKRAFILGTILTVLAVVVLMVAREPWMFYLFAVILGLAFGCCDAQESSLVAWSFGLENHGMFFGFSIFSFTIGGAMGLLALGIIFDSTGNYQTGFITFVVLSIIATALSFFLKPAISRRSPKPGSILPENQSGNAKADLS